MSHTRYVLKANFFGYNDECFYIAGSRIQHIYDNESEAKAAWHALEAHSARDFPLHEIASFFDANDAFLQQMDQFVFERCGQHIVQNGQIISDIHLPEQLSPSDTVEFVQRAGMQHYQLIALAADAPFYALWLPHDQQYLMAYDECSTSLTYFASEQMLLDNTLEEVLYSLDEPLKITGSLSDISTSPTLLQAAIGSQKNLKYNDKKQQLLIKNYDADALKAIHALLKQPLFEVRPLSIEQIMAIEQTLGAEEDWEE